MSYCIEPNQHTTNPAHPNPPPQLILPYRTRPSYCLYFGLKPNLLLVRSKPIDLTCIHPFKDGLKQSLAVQTLEVGILFERAVSIQPMNRDQSSYPTITDYAKRPQTGL